MKSGIAHASKAPCGCIAFTGDDGKPRHERCAAHAPPAHTCILASNGLTVPCPACFPPSAFAGHVEVLPVPPHTGMHARCVTAESEHAAALLEIERLKRELAASETLKRAAIDGNEAMVKSLLESEAGAAAMRSAMHMDRPYSLPSVLRHLFAAAVHLFKHHDCDTDGWEVLQSARDKAPAMIDELERALASDAGAALLRERSTMRIALSDATNRAALAEADVVKLKAERDTPEIIDFAKAVALEVQHQRARWPSEHDAGKADADWFWLIGYLAGKALHNPRDPSCPKCHGSGELRCKDPRCSEPYWDHNCTDGDPCECGGPAAKQLHRIITIAAAACNWHAAKLGKTNMRPGTDGSAVDGGA